THTFFGSGTKWPERGHGGGSDRFSRCTCTTSHIRQRTQDTQKLMDKFRLASRSSRVSMPGPQATNSGSGRARSSTHHIAKAVPVRLCVPVDTGPAPPPSGLDRPLLVLLSLE